MSTSNSLVSIHTNMEYADEQHALLQRLQSEPLLKHMINQICRLIQGINLVKNANTQPLFAVLNGENGTGKTNFIATYLQDYLHETGIISYKNEIVTRITDRCLSCLDNDTAVDNLLANRLKEAKGGIHIISDFHKGNPQTKKIVDLIYTIKDDERYANTFIILNGTYKNNRDIILDDKLQELFRLRLDFYTPSISQMVDIFSEYLFKKAHFMLTDAAKKTVWIYFTKLKWLKEMRAKQNPAYARRNIRQTTFMYTSEMVHLQKELQYSVSDNPKFILDMSDLVESNVYQKLMYDTKQIKFRMRNAC